MRPVRRICWTSIWFDAPVAILLFISLAAFNAGCRSTFDCSGVDCVQALGTTSVACIKGVCASNAHCPYGYGHCSNDPSQICETPLDTTEQCGACNNACTHDYEVCWQPPDAFRPICHDPCSAFYPGEAKTIRCGEACVNLDSNNCGACGVVCASPDHGMGVCTAAVPAMDPRAYHCGVVCASGYVVSGASCVPQTWTAQDLPGVIGTFYGIWGSSASDVYAVGAAAATGPGIIYHSTGNGSWVAEPVMTPPQSFLDVWGSSASDVYAVGSDGIYHSAGDGNWTLQQSVAGLKAIWGSGPNDIYVVGDGGIIFHSPGGGQWDSEPSTLMNITGFYSVWGSGPKDVYVGGWAAPSPPMTASVILHSTGNGNWQQLTTNTTGPINGIWGSGPNDVYAVGAGPILHSTGSGLFVAQAQVFQQSLLAVWGSTANDVYAVGAASSLFHSVGDGVWTPEDPSMAGTVHSIWGSRGGDEYVVGSKDDQMGIPGISHLP